MPNIEVIEISNDKVRASFLNYGATLYKFEVLENNEYINKVLTFDSLSDYIDNDMYLNSIVGPSAGRIANGEYIHNGKVILSKNDGDNHLHGGLDSYARKFFSYKVMDNQVVFTLLSNNSEYPGKQEITITYSLSGTSLSIDFEANSSCDIPMNLTSHIYFTSFGRDSVLDNYLKISSDKRLYLVDNVPTRITKNTDYLQNQKITETDDPFILNDTDPAVEYSSKKSCLSVSTDYDSVVVYTQNEFSQLLNGKNLGICFETQKWPNGVNIPGYNSILKAGDHYKHKTVYKFYDANAK